MKQQYESEVLYKLMERDGLNIPSSVPPYESEIKQYFIEQIKLAYPKLTDYEAEWLLYNYIEYLPADFPIESALNVTQCQFDNVVPYAYQSAILSGQTMVNIVGDIKPYQHSYIKEFYIPSVKTNTNYMVIYDTNTDIETVTNIAIGFLDSTINSWSGYNEEAPLKGKIILNSGSNPLCFRLNGKDVNSTLTVNNIMIIEYQQGMENWDIPYFEGMQSVKMPVLTTTGKNLFNTIKKNGYHNATNGNWVSDGNYKSISARVLPNTIYTQNIERNNITFWKDGVFVSGKTNSKTFTTPSNCNEVRVSCSKNFETFMLEMGEVATSYEPYKSNILSTSENVELCGIGDVRDTLDCLTGEVIERIGEIVLDGSSNVVYESGYSSFYVQVKTLAKLNDYSFSIISDKGIVLKNHDYVRNYDSDEFAISGYKDTNNSYPNDNWIYFAKKDITSVSDMKTWLAQNPITIQYQLATESVKTVDLTITNQDGEECYFMPIEGTMHMTTNGQPIKPLLDVEVPVEAITQNLASFINMKMNDEGE